MNQLAVIAPAQLPALIAASGDRAGWRFMEFFTAAIRNPNTRRAYARDVRGFVEWCSAGGIPSVAAVNTMHVAAYIEQLGKAHPAPTVKRHLAAIRHLFDYLATGGILPFNPAAAVRGPKHSVKRGKTPVLAADEARQLLDAIDITTLSGLRDRALIALMVYSFARIGAATGMRVEDVFTDQRRLWVRLNEKGGKRHEMPCHHNLEAYLHAWLDGSGLSAEPKAPLFPTIAAGSGRGAQRLTRRAITPREAHAMVRRRAKQAGVTTTIGNHTFRGTGITAYLKNGGTLEKAREMANHADTRTTRLYDRRAEDVSLDDVERISI
jgi:site-specific recombinase XerD